MPRGKGTYGSKVGRPPKKKKNKMKNAGPYKKKREIMTAKPAKKKKRKMKMY